VKEFVSYTLLRILLFVATYAVLGGAWILIADDPGVGGEFALLVAAALISSVLSLRLLSGQRNRFAAKVEARATRATARFEEARAREDGD
jgi:hypothetical protein